MKTLVAISLAAAISAQTIYPATMEVTNIHDDIVTMETATGFIYEMYGSEDYQVGDLVSLIMNNNGTPNDITDDIIISARYSGFSEEVTNERGQDLHSR